MEADPLAFWRGLLWAGVFDLLLAGLVAWLVAG